MSDVAMIERVALAITAELLRQDDGEGTPDRAAKALNDRLEIDWLDQGTTDMGAVARAAIAAMREPTGTMKRAADVWRPMYDDPATDPETYWEAMIDAALS